MIKTDDITENWCVVWFQVPTHLCTAFPPLILSRNKLFVFSVVYIILYLKNFQISQTFYGRGNSETTDAIPEKKYKHNKMQIFSLKLVTLCLFYPGGVGWRPHTCWRETGPVVDDSAWRTWPPADDNKRGSQIVRTKPCLETTLLIYFVSNLEIML